MAKKETSNKSGATEQKKPLKKLQVKKLEERIAPSMVGGGVIDPGAVEVPQDQVPQQTDSTAGQTSSTQLSQDSQTSTQNSNYTTESANTQTYESSQSSGSYDSGASTAQDGGYENLSSTSNADAPVEETPVWHEADWVSAQADGSMNITPPDGMSIDNGIANFPVDAANTALPMSEGIEIQENGAVSVALPEGAQYLAQTNAVVLPADSELAQSVPESMTSYPNPDGTITVALPEAGVSFDAQSQTLTLDNNCVNELAPPNIEFQEDGTVSVTLPEGVQLNHDGVVHLNPEQVQWMNNPPPEYVQDCDWAHSNPNGSITFDTPNDVRVDPDAGTLSMSAASFQVHFDDQIPEEVSFNSDGSMDYKVPEGTQYDADSRMLTLPPGEMPDTSDMPPEFQAHLNADQSTSFVLPPGVEYNSQVGSVHLTNEWTNEIVQNHYPQMEISPQGQVQVDLPPGTVFQADGGFTLDSHQSDFMEHPYPDYVSHGPDWVEPNPDGSVTFEPPRGFEVDPNAGTIIVSVENAATHFEEQIPEDVTFQSDGTMSIALPAGCMYDTQNMSLTFPPDSDHPKDAPEAFQPRLNNDGSFTVTIPPGVQYDATDNSVHFDNYWTNEILQQDHHNIEVTEDGKLVIDLPPNTEFHPSGGFTVPEEEANFLEEPPPAIATTGPQWCQANPDGSVSFAPPATGALSVQVDPQEGQMVLSTASCEEHFGAEIPDVVTFSTDGTMEVQVPVSADYSADTRELSLPAGTLHDISVVPPEFQPELHADGTFTCTLPTGVEFQTNTNTIEFNNYWTNEVIQETHHNVELGTDGQFRVDLPPNTQYFDNGAFTVPPEHVDFLSEPAPEFVMQGPDWVDVTPEGAVSFHPPEGVEIHPESNTLTMPLEQCVEHFAPMIPPEVSLLSDGTMRIEVPQGTSYDTETSQLTLPSGGIPNPESIPVSFAPEIQPDGSVQITLPQGVEFDSATQTVRLDNHWTNEMMPPQIEVTPMGNMQVSLPPETTHYPDGTCMIPAGSADFIAPTDVPPFVDQGPDWVGMNPDGSVSFDPPSEFKIEHMNGDPGDAGHMAVMTMSADACHEHFENHIPNEMQFNNDGTLDIRLPEGAKFDGDMRMLTLPPGGDNDPQGIPPAFQPHFNLDGSFSVTLPPGCDFQAGTNSVHFDNGWANEIIQHDHPHVELTPDGQMHVGLPPGCEFHPDGSFDVPAEHADFVEMPPPGYIMQGPEWTQMNPDGSVSFQPPTDVQVHLNPGPDGPYGQYGSMSMPVDVCHENFEHQMPDDMRLNTDGTMDIKVPDNTQFDANNRVLTLPPGEMHSSDNVPPEFHAKFNPDGSCSVTLPPGVDYSPETGSVHFNNYWTNEVIQADHHQVEVTPQGQVVVDLPPGTVHYQDGTFQVPPQHADFIEHPAPQYCMQGPEWTHYNPDGSVTMVPPPEVQFNPDQGTMNCSCQYVQEHFEGAMPDDFRLNADGSGDLKCPDGAKYDGASGILTLPGDKVSPTEIPEGIEFKVDLNGNIAVTLPAGIDYNVATNSVHLSNQWVNQLAPEPVHIAPTGELQITMPPGTQYFDTGAVSVPATNADFISNPNPTTVSDGSGSGTTQQAVG